MLSVRVRPGAPLILLLLLLGDQLRHLRVRSNRLDEDDLAGVEVHAVWLMKLLAPLRFWIPLADDRIREKLGRLPGQVVVDGGFTSREPILDMDHRGVDFIAAIADTTVRAASQFARRGVEAAFRPEAFAYHPESDTYTCPAGKVLHYERK